MRRCRSKNYFAGAVPHGCLAGFVMASVVFTPALARAEVMSKSSCAEGADNDNPQQVNVIYWDNSTASDTSGEAKFVTNMLASPGNFSSTPGIIGAIFNETLSQYYDLCTPPDYNVNDLNYNGAATSTFTVSGTIPTSPTCTQEQSLVDSFASSHGYAGNHSYVTVVQYNPRQSATPCTPGCAYHTITPGGNPYISSPYVTNTGCGGPTIYDGLGANIDHEYAETITDPLTVGGWRSATSGNEIGDGVCENLNTFPLHQTHLFYTGTAPTSHFGIQPLYSNEFSSLATGSEPYPLYGKRVRLVARTARDGHRRRPPRDS